MLDNDSGQTEDGSLLLNFSLVPPLEVADIIEELSREAQGAFQVDGVSRFAHLTVFMARFDGRVAEAAIEVVGSAALPGAPITVRHSGFAMTRNGYYEVSYAGSADLLGLQREISDRVSTFRSPSAFVVEEYFVPDDPGQLRHARETGYDLFGSDFRPHITVTRFSRDVPGELPTSTTDLSFDAHGLRIYRADSQGAATHLLWSP